MLTWDLLCELSLDEYVSEHQSDAEGRDRVDTRSVQRAPVV